MHRFCNLCTRLSMSRFIKTEIYRYIYALEQIFVCMCMCACACACAHAHVCVHMCTHACMHACMRTCACVCHQIGRTGTAQKFSLMQIFPIEFPLTFESMKYSIPKMICQNPHVPYLGGKYDNTGSTIQLVNNIVTRFFYD